MSQNAKEIIFEEEARHKLFSGIKQLADAVAPTLGPKGKNVGLEKGWGPPSITNDGSNIVKDIDLADDFENMGVSIAKEVVQKMKEKCGDGTTTSVLLLRALVEHGQRFISSGACPILLKRGIDKAVEAILEEVEKKAIPISDQKEIRNIASVAASLNEEVGEMISNAIEKVGKNGIITIEEAKSTTTSIDIVEGMQFDRGYLSSYFVTDSEKMLVNMTNPSILLVDKKISSIHDLLPILQTVASQGKELLIIADDVDADALSTLVVNKLRGTLKVAAVKAPGFGDRKKAMLEDIATLTSATVISEEVGLFLKEATPDLLGTADKISISKEHTTIIHTNIDKTRLDNRLKAIDRELENTQSSYDKEKLEERKAKLSGGVAVIRVGAATEPELKNKKQAFEDSLNSTKAAIESGIVPGGGVALLRASHVIPSLQLKGDELLGAKIVQKACEMSTRQIAQNAGLDGSVILNEVKQKEAHIGFNALNEEFEDLVQAGVIDPVKVVKNSLLLAASSAGIVLLSEALISEEKED